MTRKTPLVKDAQGGLDALKTRLFAQMPRRADSYRERFRSLARQRVTAMTPPEEEPADPRPPRDR